MTKPNVVFVLGGPGAGKGTQCSKIVEVGEKENDQSYVFVLHSLSCRHEVMLSQVRNS